MPCIWSAATDVLPHVQLSGCSFHWSQAVWRKVQELGYQPLYFQNNHLRKFLRRLLSLPYLPDHEIAGAFFHLQQKPAAARVRDLMEYVECTWVESSLWPPRCWSVFDQPIRTNNDVEGWHHSLNRRASGKSQLPFYVLVKLLQKEAVLVAVQVRLVSERKLKRVQRRKYRQLQAKLFDLWQAYEDDQQSADGLLKACAHLCNAPRME